MTPHEKAVRLVDRYLDEVINDVDENFPLEIPKRLAIIAVNEILETIKEVLYGIHYLIKRDYWEEVKQEIEKL